MTSEAATPSQHGESVSGRLLRAVFNIRNFIVHSIEQPCLSCQKHDELKEAAKVCDEELTRLRVQLAMADAKIEEIGDLLSGWLSIDDVEDIPEFIEETKAVVRELDQRFEDRDDELDLDPGIQSLYSPVLEAQKPLPSLPASQTCRYTHWSLRSSVGTPCTAPSELDGYCVAHWNQIYSGKRPKGRGDE